MAQTNTTKPKRRTYSKELKAYLVEQALTGKRSIANLAQGHGINVSIRPTPIAFSKHEAGAHQYPYLYG
ncbi:transposase [Moraxella osloensis]|uniref:transposase n=1 Tax=Faucicola osloensis TaxID=34062 RepID=UPI001D0D17B9|nr:transposase [Moraxella osloensis]